jgi:two-component system, LuxR family, response regulator FixJ
MSADLSGIIHPHPRLNEMVIRKLVHVVDHEASVRRSLDFLLGTAGFEVQKWPDGESFLNAAERSAACVVLAIHMPGMDGLQVQKEMASRGLNLPVIVLTGHGDIATAVRAMRAGAVDFIQKPSSRERLLDALEIGFSRLADRELQRQRERWAKTQTGGLTRREQEVLEGLACGYPNKTIAYDLGISSRTVEVHRANVMEKLEVTYFADALRIAFAAGMGSAAEWRRKYLASSSVRTREAIQRNVDQSPHFAGQVASRRH